jgi:hypothetical protein
MEVKRKFPRGRLTSRLEQHARKYVTQKKGRKKVGRN